MKLNKKLILTLGTGVFLIGGIATLSGCSNSNASSSGKSNVTTVTVGTSGAPKPFTYVDSNNKIVGYDIDTVRAIDKKLPDYKFTFKKTEFPSILEGLDSGRFQLGANNFAYNPQRAKKYYFSKPIFQDQDTLVVKSSNNSIKKLSDIAGKTTVAQPGINFTTAIENFNKKASVKSKITYSQEDPVKQLQDVQDGKADYVLIDKPLYNNYQKTYNLKGLKAVDLSPEDTKQISQSTPYSYLLLPKTADGKKLLKQVNKAITEIQKDGTAKKISEKYFYSDYVPTK